MSSRTRLLRRVLIPLVCVLVVVVTLFAVLRSLFPSEKLRELAVSKLEETSGLSISVENATISFVHWRVGIRVTGVEVLAPVGPREAASPAAEAPRDSTGKATEVSRLATIPRLGIAVSILPLLRKEVVVNQLYVDDPQISLRLGAGPILPKRQGMPSGRPAAMPVSFSLSNVIVSNANVELRDMRTGSVIVLKQLDANSSIRGDKSTGTLLFEGKSSVKEISIESTRKLPIQIPPLNIKASWKASLALKDKVLELEKISVKVSDFPIDATGKVNLSGEKPELDVKIKVEKIAAAKLLALVPKRFLEKIGGARINGQIEIYAGIRGQMPSPEIDVDKFIVSVGESRIDGRVHVSSQEPQSVSFETTGNLKLNELAGILPMTSGPKVTSGTVSFHIIGEGIVKELKTDPLALQVRGEASINAVNLELAQPSPPVSIETAKMLLSGSGVDIRDVTARVGSSVFNATGSVRNWKERLVELEVRSPSLNLGELLPPKSGQRKAPNKGGPGIALPSGRLPAKGVARLQVDKLKFGNFGADHLKAQLVFGGDSIVVTNLSMNAVGGKCTGKCRLGLSGQSAPTYSASFSADDLDMGELLNTLTPIKNFMKGTSFLEIAVEGNIPKDSSPLKSVGAKGQVKIAQARAIASPLVAGIASWVGLQKSDQYDLKDVATPFLVQNGRIIVPQCRLEERNSTWNFAGSTGFDGTLDYKVNVALSQEYSKRTGSLQGLDRLFKDEQGRVILDFIVGGTGSKPAFKWDSSRTQQRVQELLAKKLQGQLETQTKKVEGVKQQAKTELEKRTDTLRVEAATKGAKLLEDLLKKRKK